MRIIRHHRNKADIKDKHICKECVIVTNENLYLPSKSTMWINNIDNLLWPINMDV